MSNDDVAIGDFQFGKLRRNPSLAVDVGGSDHHHRPLADRRVAGGVDRIEHLRSCPLSIVIAPAEPTPGGLNGNRIVSGASKPASRWTTTLRFIVAGPHERHFGLNDFEVVRHLIGHGHRQLVDDAVDKHGGVGLAEHEVSHAKVQARVAEMLGDAAKNMTPTELGTRFLEPGLLFKAPIDQISLGMALVLGTAGMPHS